MQYKNKDTFGMHEEGNVVNFGEFQTYLDETYPEHNLDVYRDFVSRMKDIALDCYMASFKTLNPAKRRNSFELFGFDFMIDEDFRTWLIEVNTNPQLFIKNSGMKHVTPKMFDDLFDIVLDPVFDRMTQEEKNAKIDNGNFDLLYSRSRSINKRRPL